MEESTARKTLDRARIFLRLSDDLIEVVREASVALIEAAIVFGRSITLHLQKEFRHVPGFDEWYGKQLGPVQQDSLCRFFLDKRNFILKEGQAPLDRNINVTVGLAVELSVATSIQVKRGNPWYRRSPKILWEDLNRAITLRLRRYEPALRDALVTVDAISAGWLPEEKTVLQTYPITLDPTFPILGIFRRATGRIKPPMNSHTNISKN